MLEWVLGEFVKDMMVLLPVSVIGVAMFVGIVVHFDIHPIKNWLCEQD